jgi:hypothetical protein
MNQTVKPEFEAFKAVYDALEPLDDEARGRIVKSIITLLSIDGMNRAGNDDGDLDEPAEVAVENAAENAPTYSTFAELYAAANPTTNSEKALVAGYWLQVCQSSDNFTGQSANKELTHLGHKIDNITAAIDNFRNVKPNLVLQLRKSGSSKQARKTYKVSDAGVKRVYEMIGG